MKKNRVSFLTRRFVVSYSLFLLIILLLVVYLHQTSESRSRDEFWYRNENAFQGTINLMDNNLSIMDSACRQLGQNSSFYRLSAMQNTSDSDFYLSGYSMKKSLVTYLYSFRDLPVNTAFIYLRNTHYLLSTNTFNEDTLYYMRNYGGPGADIDEWREQIYGDNGSGKIYSLSGKVLEASDDAYLYLIDMNKLSYRDIPATMGFHISKAGLHNIFQSVTGGADEYVLVTDADGEPLFCLDDLGAEVETEQEERLQQLVKNAGAGKTGEEYHVIRLCSEFNDWNYYLIQPEKIWQSGDQRAFYLALFATALSGLLMILVMVRRNIHPIRELDDELQETISDRDQLKDQVEEVKPILYDNYLRQLFSANVTMPDELEYIRNYLHLERPELHFYALHIVLYENDLVEAAEEPQLGADAFLALMAENFSYQNVLYLYTPKKRTYALLIPFEGDEEQTLYALQEKVVQLHTRLLQEYDIWFFAGIGLPCSFENIWESYQQAQDAASYTSKNYIFLPYSMLKKDSHNYYYPMDVSMKLINFIKNGNRAQIQETFGLIHRENVEQRALPFHLLRYLLSDVRNTLLKARFSCNGEHTREELAEIDQLLASEDLTLRGCQDIALRLCELFSQNTEKDNLIDSIVTYIGENYKDPSICLSKIADEFHISESFFSHMFKEKMNINFSVYLEELRMTEAARLIKEGELALTEVGAEVGYNNQTSFRRAFKKKFGVTPSSYQ